MTKEVTHQFNILGSTSVSGNTTTTCSISGTIYRDSICYQVNISGTPAGYVEVDGSADYSPGYPQGPQGTGVARSGNWVTMASVSVIGSVTPMVFDVTPTSLPWTRCNFVCSTGSGVIDMWTAAKSY
jgi:hypothetical protein